MRLLITSVESNVKNSVMLEAFGPVLAVAEEIIPHTNGLKGKQLLSADARKAFGTHMLAAGMNGLISRSPEGVYYLIMGKLFYKVMSVGLDLEQSASFFECAISSGNTAALYYLGRQCERGLGVIYEESKAVQLHMKWAELEDPGFLYEIGECFQYGFGMQKDDSKCFVYYTKSAHLGLSVASER